MLLRLILISFVGVQTFAEENLALSQEALTGAIEQAIELQRQTGKLLNGKLTENFLAQNFFESQPNQKGCPSQGLKGSTDTVKGCVKNTTLPISENVSHQGDTLALENANHILVFVSFSMPEASLKSLAQEAQRDASQGVSTQGDASQGISFQQPPVVLVMRGLYQDSFVKTALKLQKLGIAVDIHPELFETHHVTSVPTFVKLENGQPIHTLKGNVTLDFAVKTFEKQRVGRTP